MFEHPILSLDGSPAAEAAIPFASFLARTLQQPLHLVTVLPIPADLRPAESELEAELVAMQRQRRHFVEEYLDGIRRQLEADGVWAEPAVVEGNVVAGILDAIEAHRSGLIVMSTHGYSGIRRWLLGSVADRIVRTATVPVLLAPHREQAVDAAAPVITRIVLPLDGSERAEEALPYARRLADSLAAPILVVRAASPNWISGPAAGAGSFASADVIAMIEKDTHDYVDARVRDLRSAGFGAEGRAVAFASAAEEIERAAEDVPGAIILMTTHGRSGVQRAVLGSVTDRVIRSGVAPVLVIPSAMNA